MLQRSLKDAALDLLLEFPWEASMQESFMVPPQEARHVSIPQYMLSGHAGRWARQDDRFRQGFWTHQGMASDELEDGNNICLTTKTSSGKSDVFIARMLRVLDINPDATAFAIYPAKALQSDQLHNRWIGAFKRAGLNPDEIGIINGDIKNDLARHAIIEKSKLVLITPDTLQSWVMANLDKPSVKKFLANLELLILDEAHIYNEILGSHAPHLFTRLQFAAYQLKAQAGITPGVLTKSKGAFQILAASASLRKATGFMQQLTGQEFVEIGPEHDGSPKRRQDVIHIAAPAGDEIKIATSLLQKFLSLRDVDRSGTAISFIDSRKAVEEMALELNHRLQADVVTPLRGSYSEHEREAIQDAMRRGDKRLLACTSIAELGLDYPDMEIGVCVGKPASSSALQQRLGRVGRARDGLFVVIAPKNAFAKGKRPITLEEYCRGGNSEPTVHIENPSILAGHALCLNKEMELMGLAPNTNLRDPRYRLNTKLVKIADELRTGKPLADDDLATRHRMYRGKPHLATGLRDAGSGHNLSIMAAMTDGTTRNLGAISMENAIRECYPEGIYLHRSMAFEVETDGWLNGEKAGGPRTIHVKQIQTRDRTRPIIQRWAFLQKDQKLRGAQEIRGRGGRICEVSMSISDETVGYYRSSPGRPSTKRTYNNSKSDDKTARRYRHSMSTSGVLFDFGRTSFSFQELDRLAVLIKSAYCTQYNISPNNIDIATSRIYQPNGEEKRHELGHALVVYDRGTTGLRLTRRLTSNIGTLIPLMVDDSLDRELVQKFSHFYSALTGTVRVTVPEKWITNPDPEDGTQPVDTKPLKTGDIVWHQATRQTNSRRNKPVHQNGGGQWVRVDGTKKIEDLPYYRIVPLDNLAAPRSPKSPGVPEVTQWVPRRVLLREQPSGSY